MPRQNLTPQHLPALPPAHPLQPPPTSTNPPTQHSTLKPPKCKYKCICTTRFTNLQTQQSTNKLSRDQYTLSLFLDEIELRHIRKRNRAPYWRKYTPDMSFIAYISVLITRVSLVELYRSEKIFCGKCVSCGEEVFGNVDVIEHVCRRTVGSARGDVPSGIDSTGHRVHGEQTRKLQLSWNPSLLAGFSDETGGLALHGHGERHNLSLTDQAVRGLTGLTTADFEIVDDGSSRDDEEVSSSSAATMGGTVNVQGDRILSRLKWIESHLLWARVTLVMGWTDGCADHEGGSASARVKSSTTTSNKVDDSVGLGSGKDKIVVLDVLG